MGELEFRAQILAHVDEGEKFNQEWSDTHI
jgi:hypothetical protein